MAFSVAKWFVLIILSVIMKPQILIEGQQVPCAFFFGDSQFDNGNNNMLITQAKANYPPYGVDYPTGPTGRFTNGRNIADYIAQFLGFLNPILPFATASGSDILKGVNYASGAAGILPESGIRLGDRISMDRQLVHHQITITRLTFQVRPPTTVTSYLNKCLYTVNMGSNDYLNNFLLPQLYPSSILFTPDQFAAKLIQKYSQQLRTLYSYGARKIAVFGIGLLGCLPQELAAFPPTNGSPCVDSINNNVQLFNNRLVTLINTLNNDLLSARFTYINITSISQGDPSSIGFTVFNAPCCPVQANGQCAPNQVPCSNRNQYIFFDNFHPTELLNFVTATRSYNATVPSDAFPVDIARLVQP